MLLENDNSSDEQTISIIIPMYNSEKTINKCLESILAQTFENYEILVIDDGSTDKSKSICEKYQLHDDRIKIFSKQNAGVSSARNYGLEIARKNFIQFVDADDFLEPNCCQVLIDEIIRENFDLVVCGMFRYYSKKNKAIISLNEFTIDNNDFENNFSVLYKSGYLNAPINKLYRNDIITENFIQFKDSIFLGEDLIFNLEYIRVAGKISVLSNTLYNINEENINSITRQYNKNKYNQVLYLYNYLKEYIIDFYNVKEAQEINCLFFLRSVYIIFEQLIFSEQSNDSKNLIINEIVDSESMESILLFNSSHSLEMKYYMFFLKKKNVILLKLSIIVRFVIKKIVRRIR